MKDLSFLELKNSIAARMRKGIRNFCNGDGSTSTLNQQNPPIDYDDNEEEDDDDDAISSIYSPNNNKFKVEQSPPTTLEQMILNLEIEEEIARKSKIAMKGRMSSVTNSDILRSARNALNQYPRFSLDGKDAMYRSSFRNFHQTPGRHSVCCEDSRELPRERVFNQQKDSRLGLPATIGGKRMVWCKPGVIGKLMGLDAMPVPITNNKERLNSIIKRQTQRRKFERQQMEKSKAGFFNNANTRMVSNSPSRCSNQNKRYCVIKPV